MVARSPGAVASGPGGFLSELKGAGVHLFLHKQALDTSTAAGKAMFGMVSVFAEFEADVHQGAGQRWPCACEGGDPNLSGFFRALWGAKAVRARQLDPAIPGNVAVRAVTLLSARFPRAKYACDLDPDRRRRRKIPQSGERSLGRRVQLPPTARPAARGRRCVDGDLHVLARRRGLLMVSTV